MKKILLIIGILTQSYFGISQKIKIIDYKKLPIIQDIRFGLTSLTNDGSIIYALTLNPTKIIKYNSKTLEIIKTINLKLPNTTYEEIKGYKYSNGITYDGNYLWVAFAAKGKIYKINKNSGKIITHIPGPPIEHIGHQYDGLDFDGEYFWIIRNNYIKNSNKYPGGPVLFKLSTSGKVLSKYDIPCYHISGLDYKEDYLWMNQVGDGNNGILSKFSINDCSFTETYHLDSTFGNPNSISFMNQYAYINTGSASTRKIYKIKLLKE